jgi:hypothetical protein
MAALDRIVALLMDGSLSPLIATALVVLVLFLLRVIVAGIRILAGVVAAAMRAVVAGIGAITVVVAVVAFLVILVAQR